MKRILPLLFIVFAFSQCDDDDTNACSSYATIKDLTGLDGCGFVFELVDGSRLEPVRQLLFCGTPPLPKEITEDPLYGFEFMDGKRVKISYSETENLSICMVWPVVKITCIHELIAPAED